MANPDDKTKDTTQLSKQESIAKKTHKVNNFLLSVFKLNHFIGFRKKRKLVYLYFNMEKGMLFIIKWFLMLLLFWNFDQLFVSCSQISSILHKPSYVPGRSGESGKWENCLATNFDVAVIRCLFVSKWTEEGVFWAVTYLHRRLKGLNFSPDTEPQPRKRSNSLPVPKIEVTSHEAKSQAETKEKLPNIAEGTVETLTNNTEGER